MTIPTYADRMQEKFGSDIEEIKESINNSILRGNANYHNDGYNYFVARVGEDWVNEELRNWLIKEYKAAGWGLNFVWEDPHDERGDCMVEVYEYKGD